MEFDMKLNALEFEFSDFQLNQFSNSMKQIQYFKACCKFDFFFINSFRNIYSSFKLIESNQRERGVSDISVDFE